MYIYISLSLSLTFFFSLIFSHPPPPRRSDSYQDLLINHSKSSVRLVTASPLANGFYGGGGACVMLYSCVTRVLIESIIITLFFL